MTCEDRAGSALLGGASPRLLQGRTGRGKDLMSGLDMGEQNTPASSPISAGTSNAPCLTPQFNMAMEPQEGAESLGLPYLLHLSPQALEGV